MKNLSQEKSVIKPPQLQNGDVVALVSPASPYSYLFPSDLAYQQHIKQSMSLLNLQFSFGLYMNETYGYLAGPDMDRAYDIMSGFQEDRNNFILANRGGYGCDRLLRLLDYDIIQKHPKIIMGYSDLTALINAIHFKTGLVTFYGPMGLDDWNSTVSTPNGPINYNRYYVEQILFYQSNGFVYSNPAAFNTVSIKTIHGGRSRGKLIGGNLSVFITLLGTEFLPIDDWSQYILFLEEVGEEPYRVDRMLATLELAGVFDKVAGLVWGTCTACTASNPSQSLTIDQVFDRYFGSMKVPVYTGAMIGHDILAQFTLPIGIQVEIDADVGTITLLESPVSKQ